MKAGRKTFDPVATWDYFDGLAMANGENRNSYKLFPRFLGDMGGITLRVGVINVSEPLVVRASPSAEKISSVTDVLVSRSHR